MTVAQGLADPLLREHERDEPTEEAIARVRAAFPTEREVDHVLTRKMRNRRRPVTGVPELADIVAALERFLTARRGRPTEVRDARWMTGGASKIQVRFTVAALGDLVLRMEPQESLNSTSRRREYDVIRAVGDAVPVPRVHWVDPEGEWFPQPALVYALVPGSAKPAAARARIAGIGIDYAPGLRGRLAGEFVDILARLHTLDVARLDLPSYDIPALETTEAAEWQLNRARRVWEEDRGHDHPLMEVAADWLAAHAPRLDHASVVHGDYRSGNFLFDEDAGRITAVLDWERSHLGDRHRDLAWATAYPFGHLAEDGATLLACGLLPVSELLDRYEEASGLPVDHEVLAYYRILNSYQSVVTAWGSAYRIAKLGRSHQDVLLAGLEATGTLMARCLVDDLEEVL